MSDQSPGRLRALFEQALAQSPDDWPAFIERECGDDPSLAAELGALLEAHAGTDSIADAVADAARSLLGADVQKVPAGYRIGAYRIVREIGQGGMGRVFLGERDDDQYAGRVAIKLLARTGAGRAEGERFRNECQVLADLEHPGIARLIDAGTTDDGDPYLVMEYIDGEPIDAYCNSRRLTVDERVALFRQLCDAVERAHRNLIVHRDIKASNVLVTADGTPKLLDFGIAKLLDIDRARALELHLTEDVNRLLTPATASPEQLRGDPVTTATDVYSLGMLLYRLLTDRTPYEAAGTDRFALPRAIIEDAAARPSAVVRRQATPATAETRRTTIDKLARRLSGDLDAIVLKALRKEPEHRYATPRLFADDLDRHLERRPVSARSDSVGYVTRRFLWRHRQGFAAGAVVLAGAVALVGFYTARLAVERDRAQVQARRAEEVSDFLTDLFQVATPDENRGEVVTAREILDRGAERIGNDLRTEPGVQAALMRVIGSAYGKLGLYDTSAAALEEALATREAIGGADDAVLGDALHDLGTVRLAQARYPEARSLLERALEVRRHVYGDVHRDVAATLRALSDLEFELANYDESFAYLDEAERVVRAIEPMDEEQLADVLLARGMLRKRLGDYDAAIVSEQQAVEIRERVSGADHPATLEARDVLADALNDGGRMGEAEELLRDNLEIKRRVLPPGHPDIAKALTNLASSLKMQGRPEEAEPLQAEALELLEATYKGDHPEVAVALNNLANLRHDLRDFDSALALHQESLAMNRRIYGDDHPTLADSYNNIGALMLDLDDSEGALLMYQRALDLDRRSLGEDHPYVGQDLLAIGVTQNVLGREEEAEETIRGALADLKRTAGPEHPQTFNAMRELAIVLARRGNCAEAKPLLESALPGLEAAFPGNPWEVAMANAQLGACIADAEPERGEHLMRQAYARLVELHGPDDRLTDKARELLADYLRRTGRDEEARALKPASSSATG